MVVVRSVVLTLVWGLIGCDPEYPEAYPTPADVAWARAPEAPSATGSALGADGEIFVLLGRHSVSRRDPSSGDEVWRTALDAALCAGCDPGSAAVSWASPLVVGADGNIWVVGAVGTEFIDGVSVGGDVVVAKLSAEDGSLVNAVRLPGGSGDASADGQAWIPSRVEGDADGLWVSSKNTLWRFDFGTSTRSWTTRFPENVTLESIAVTRAGSLWIGGGFRESVTIAGSRFSQPDNEGPCGHCVGPLGSFVAELDPSSGEILRAKQVFVGHGQQFSLRLDALGDDLAVVAVLGQGTSSQLCQARLSVASELDTVWQDCRPGVVAFAAAAVAPNGNLAVAGSAELQPDGGLDLGGGPFNAPQGTADLGFGAYYRGRTGAHVWSQRFGATEAFNGDTRVLDVVVPDGGVLIVSGTFTTKTRFSGTTLRTNAGAPRAFIVKLRLP
jgi:hypothetical protein